MDASTTTCSRRWRHLSDSLLKVRQIMTQYNNSEHNTGSRSPELPQSHEIERSELSDAAASLAAAESGESGENGNLTPLSPLSPAPSGEQNVPEDNAAFLAEVFASAGEHETVAVCSKLGDPTSGAWIALDAKRGGQTADGRGWSKKWRKWSRQLRQRLPHRFHHFHHMARPMVMAIGTAVGSATSNINCP